MFTLIFLPLRLVGLDSFVGIASEETSPDGRRRQQLREENISKQSPFRQTATPLVATPFKGCSTLVPNRWPSGFDSSDLVENGAVTF